MNIINSGSTYRVYGDDLKTMQSLPAATYDLQFAKFTGFFLEKRPDLITGEEKIYGKSPAKAEKTLCGFKEANRNFGVLLSGRRGVGKSLFARLLAKKAIEEGYPVIVVSCYTPGIADFLSSIDQEIVVFFDEFEKTFAKTENINPQIEMLPLFDGTDNGKKLFVITCNRISELNECFLDRPGRFYYHFEMTIPSDDEVAEYVRDNLTNPSDEIVRKILQYGAQTELTYDCLRAIVEELNRGYGLDETMEDLNISRITDFDYTMYVELNNGMAGSVKIRLNDYISGCYEKIHMWVNNADGKDFLVEVNSDSVVYDVFQGVYTLPLNQVKIDLDEDDFTTIDEYQEAKRNLKAVRFEIRRNAKKNTRSFMR